MSIITAGTTTTTAFTATGDTNGNLVFQTGSGATTALTIGSDQTATFVGTASATKLIPTGGTSAGNGMYLPAANSLGYSTNGTERMRIDSSGNVGIGTTNTGTAGLSLLQSFNLSWENSSTESLPNIFRQASSAATVITNGYKRTATANGFASSYGSSWAKTAISLGTATGAITFYTDAAATTAVGTDVTPTERMRITSDGNVGVGLTPVSNNRLMTRGASATSSDYAFGVQNSTPADLMWVRCDGLINTGTSSVSPYNNTTATAANMVVTSGGDLQRSTSSLRYKTDVTDATHGLADVLKLRSVTYKGINDGDTVFGGLIAEEVHDAGLTEFVAYNDEGEPDALNYGNMVALLVKAIQEQQQQIKTLQDQVTALTAPVKE